MSVNGPSAEERKETIRQQLKSLLEGNKMSLKALSKEVRQPEKEVLHHLEQLKKSGVLKIIPAECSDCGYVFETREKAKKPSKCPDCKSTHIEEPLYSLIG